MAFAVSGLDVAFEIRVVQRVVFHLHRKALIVRIEARPLGYRPAPEHVAHLQAEVVVPPAGVVQLHDEDRALTGGTAAGRRRLTRLAEITLALVVVETHERASAGVVSAYRRKRRPNNGVKTISLKPARQRSLSGSRSCRALRWAARICSAPLAWRRNSSRRQAFSAFSARSSASAA